MGMEITGALTHLRLAVIFAAIGGIIQSLIGIALTITGIVIYMGDCPTSSEFTFGTLLRSMYFTDTSKCTSTQSAVTQSPEDIFIWVCVYLGISTVWLGISFCLIHFVKNDTLEKSYGFIHAWIYSTLLICAVDLGLGILFGIDYDRLSKLMNPVAFLNELMKIAAGIMMTIALRGYIIYLFNFSIATYLIGCVIQIHKNLNKDKKSTQQHSVLSRGPINGYDSSIEARSSHWLAGAGHMDRPHISEPNARTSIYNRTSSYHDSNAPFYSQVDGVSAAKSPGIMKRPASAGPAPWERVAQREREPNTPSPDYSPPTARADRLKPTLKPVPPYKRY